MKKVLSLIFLGSMLITCSPPSTDYKASVQNPEFLHRSIKQITDRIVHDIFSPPVASRIYAYSSIAAYEAIIGQEKDYMSLSGQLNGLGPVPKPRPGIEYCFPLASVQAALTVGRALVFSEDKVDEFVQNIMQEFRQTGIPDDVFENSVEYGTQVANHIIKWSSLDNYKQTRSFPKYTIVDDPATWKPTPPAYMDAVEPHWNKIRPFVLDSAQQFKPGPPTPFSIKTGSPFFADATQVYQVGKNLTNEQRAIAFFWDCNPFIMNVKGHVMFATKKISPGGHWMNISRIACRQIKASFVRSAEAYLRVSLSLADGFISSWDEKYRSKLVRPETYINQYIDEEWTPLLQTPPFPEHTSAHSVISSAAAVALTKLIGDGFAFTDSTEIEFGLQPRSFSSFIQASEEAAISRMYGGIHYRPAYQIGIKEGRSIGNYIVSKIVTHADDKVAIR